jgi:hypothetical protein
MTFQLKPAVADSFEDEGRSQRGAELEQARFRSQIAPQSRKRRKDAIASQLQVDEQYSDDPTKYLETPILIVSFDDTRSQRDAGLALAKIRSHAAAAAHQRRKAKKSERIHELHQRFGIHSKPRIQHNWQGRSLTKQDPFTSYAGSEIPSICHRAIEFCM